MSDTSQPGVLLATTLWWPLSARLATRLIHHGCRVSAVCPPGHILRHVAGIDPIFKYGVARPRASLEGALEAARPDVVIPCDDRVVWQLHEIHARRPDLRPLIEASLGPASEYPIVAHRELFLEVSRSLGIRVPETRHLDSVEDVRAWFAGGATRAVLKRDGTWGGDGVRIARSEAEAIELYGILARRPAVTAPIKRYLVNRDPLAVWAWRRRATAAITIQSFIEGRPANAMLACWKGELVGMVAVEVLSSQGETGAGVVVRVIENQQIADAARKLADRLKLTGFYGLDFMIDRSEAAYLIEMNPRCTQLGHLALKKQGDLAGLFCAKLKGTKLLGPSATGASSEPGQSPIQNEVIAFFPQALVSHPRGGLAQGAHLDVPWDQPGLVRELMRPPPPDRRLIARIYHHFNAPRKVATVEFESLPDAPPAMSNAAPRADLAPHAGAVSTSPVAGAADHATGGPASVVPAPPAVPAPTSVAGAAPPSAAQSPGARGPIVA